eukprot:TRINITY_DN2387_c0_g1_i5.p1 TRINITY_DN2387_c0_g1~~TRINITY_DN2387_c0_g1_i5.p1  ORF type:complete len:193 (-),score=31.25 TRINITY_DN2387_c0_g1_i5:171-749(-)
MCIRDRHQTRESEPVKLGVSDRLYGKKAKPQFDHYEDTPKKMEQQQQQLIGVGSKGKKQGFKKDNNKQKFMQTASSQFGLRAQTSEPKPTRFPFVMVSPQKFLKNQAFIKNIIQSTQFKHGRPISEAEELQDVKYKTGEGIRALKLATIKQDEIFESASPLVNCNDNVILQKKKKDLKGFKKKCEFFVLISR